MHFFSPPCLTHAPSVWIPFNLQWLWTLMCHTKQNDANLKLFSLCRLWGLQLHYYQSSSDLTVLRHHIFMKQLPCQAWWMGSTPLLISTDKSSEDSLSHTLAPSLQQKRVWQWIVLTCWMENNITQV
jgi:hypothetical protein